MQSVGPPRWSDEALEWMGRLTVACSPDESMSLDHGVGLYCDGLDPYGQDDGEANWRIPLGRVNWAIPNQVPLHNWAMAALAGYEGSNPGPLMASETWRCDSRSAAPARHYRCGQRRARATDGDG
jgi:aminobenzoyl-glutamate utilization protein B